MAEAPDKVKFVFSYAPDYRLCAANGVWASVTTKGDVRLEFFVEGFDVPLSVTHSLTEGGQIGAEIERKLPDGPEKTAVLSRRVHVGVLLPGNQLESWAALLTEKANELKGLTSGKDK